jgi:hypothetical protein
VCVEVFDERDHVDHRLGGEPRDGGRSEVVYLGAGEQRLDPFALSCKPSRPCGAVLDDLDSGVSFAGAREVCCGGTSAIGSIHDRERTSARPGNIGCCS